MIHKRVLKFDCNSGMSQKNSPRSGTCQRLNGRITVARYVVVGIILF